MTSAKAALARRLLSGGVMAEALAERDRITREALDAARELILARMHADKVCPIADGLPDGTAFVCACIGICSAPWSPEANAVLGKIEEAWLLCQPLKKPRLPATPPHQPPPARP